MHPVPSTFIVIVVKAIVDFNTSIKSHKYGVFGFG
jgi:hypothetical protein